MGRVSLLVMTLMLGRRRRSRQMGRKLHTRILRVRLSRRLRSMAGGRKPITLNAAIDRHQDSLFGSGNDWKPAKILKYLAQHCSPFRPRAQLLRDFRKLLQPVANAVQ